ncbi:MAG: hypothetical protein V4622_14105 [Bacteroidota bacterium]
MEQKENNQKITSLEEFDNLADIQVSSEWNESLLRKIELSNRQHKTSFTKTKVILSLIVLFCLNLGFLTSFFIQKESKSTTEFSTNLSSEKEDLELLSDQLFINLN